MIFYKNKIQDKLSSLEISIGEALTLSQRITIDGPLARDVDVVKTCELPQKSKLSTLEGQARLIHDLASIELQAMELAVRGLYEYPDTPIGFRHELAEVARAEASHLKLCLECLKSLGYEWGHWPVHIALWQCVSPSDSLIKRVFIVHRYLEASGLDAGESILKRLSGVKDKTVLNCVAHIHREEIAHVEFGSRWFREFCESENKNPDDEFLNLFEEFSIRLPRREEPNLKLRRQAGFNDIELKRLIRI